MSSPAYRGWRSKTLSGGDRLLAAMNRYRARKDECATSMLEQGDAQPPRWALGVLKSASRRNAALTEYMRVLAIVQRSDGRWEGFRHWNRPRKLLTLFDGE